MNLSVLVTDGEERAALAVVRSLGRAGHRVLVCAPKARSLAGASRYCIAEQQVPDPLATPAAFAAAIERVVQERQVDALIPISEAALLALLPHREKLAGVHIPFPIDRQFRRICDKAAVLRAASELGIAVPSQQTLACPQERPRLGPDGLRFPLVLKPARSVGDSAQARIKSGPVHVAGWNSLQAALASYRYESYPLLLQQRIVGPGIGIFLLIWDGEVIATFAHRRIREKPPFGGVSVYRESIPADPDLVLRSRRLLEQFGWQGVAMVEYKVDETSGRPHLMEVNGRFWGSLQLAIDAGVDFPTLLLAAALGKQPPPVTRYRVGIRTRWWWGDVDHLLARLRRSKRDLGLPEEAPGRFRALTDFFTLWRPGDRNEILRLDDPMPFVRETLAWMSRG